MMDRTSSNDEPLYRERRRVRFQEVDAAGIVFYARVFDYFHDAYVGFLRERGAPLDEALQDGAWVAPLQHAEADYRRPLRFGDEIEIVIAEIRVSETEYEVAYRIENGGETACVGETRHVSVDPMSFRRTAIPETLRDALDPE